MNKKKFKIDFTNVYFICGAMFSLVGGLFIAVALYWIFHYDSFSATVDGSPGLMVGGFLGLGTVTFVLGVPILVRYIGRLKKQKAVYERGSYITLPVSDIRVNTRLRVNGRYPYVVEAQYEDPVTKEVYLFQSENLFSNPTQKYGDETVRVYVDLKDPKTYYMDIEGAVE